MKYDALKARVCAASCGRLIVMTGIFLRRFFALV